jgi:hypothetical protein
MSEVSVVKNTLPAMPEANPWLDAAAEAASDLGKIIKFTRGKYYCGEELVPIGSEYVAHVNEIARGWTRFFDKRATDRRIGKLADRYVVPKREDLGDQDESQWERTTAGEPRDPWSLQWYLPLVPLGTDELATFISGSNGGDGAIRTLCGAYGRRLAAGALPVVALKSLSYRHAEFGMIDKPVFEIVGWEGDTFVPQVAPVAGTRNAEMDDEIPF